MYAAQARQVNWINLIQLAFFIIGFHWLNPGLLWLQPAYSGKGHLQDDKVIT